MSLKLAFSHPKYSDASLNDSVESILQANELGYTLFGTTPVSPGKPTLIIADRFLKSVFEYCAQNCAQWRLGRVVFQVGANC
jgi:hypothetical protein